MHFLEGIGWMTHYNWNKKMFGLPSFEFPLFLKLHFLLFSMNISASNVCVSYDNNHFIATGFPRQYWFIVCFQIYCRKIFVGTIVLREIWPRVQRKRISLIFLIILFFHFVIPCSWNYLKNTTQETTQNTTKCLVIIIPNVACHSAAIGFSHNTSNINICCSRIWFELL